LPAWVICWHTFTSLALRSHWPITNLSTGALKQALLRQCREPERNSLLLVKFSYWRLPGTTKVCKQEGRGGGIITLIRTCLVTNHLTPCWTGFKAQRVCVVTEKSTMKADFRVAQFWGLTMSRCSVFLSISPLVSRIGFSLMGIVRSQSMIPVCRVWKISQKNRNWNRSKVYSLSKEERGRY
jgi:hypothetical protein